MSAETVSDLGALGPVVVGRRLPEIPLLGQVEILSVLEEGEVVSCNVPRELINHEEVPVKEEWVVALAGQMDAMVAERGRGTGQRSPITLGYIDDEASFRIMDGFHRDGALGLKGEPVVHASVERVTWDQLYDFRIFTAKDNVHVRFSRVVQWIREVWQHSGLAEAMSVEQAVMLYRFGGDGSKLHLRPEDVVAAKQWVERKENQWQIAAMTIYSHLRIAETVDPLLVHSTREKTASTSLSAPTQSIIKVFSDYLPNNFELQNLIMGIALQHNLTAPQVKSLSMRVQGQQIDDAHAILSSVNLASPPPLYADSRVRALRRASDARYKGAAVLDVASREIERIMQRTQLALDRGEVVTPEMSDKLYEAVRRVEQLRKELGAMGLKLSQLAAPPNERRRLSLVSDPEPTNIAAKPPSSKPSVGEPGKLSTVTSQEADDREPEPRLNVIFNLPSFGKFSVNDWSHLDPQYRFALALDHPRITNHDFGDHNQLILEVLKVAELMPSRGSITTQSEFNSFVRTLLAQLRPPICRAGPVIQFDRATITLKITSAGKKHLETVVRQARLDVDEAKRLRNDNNAAG